MHAATSNDGLLTLDLSRKVGDCSPMGKGRKRSVQKMKNRKNQAKKKARELRRREVVRKSRSA
jgi:hypothetical protein